MISRRLIDTSLYLLSWVFIVGSTIAWYRFFAFAPLGDDSAAFLSTARRLAEGAILYRDVTIWYTPLVLYVFAAVDLITPVWAQLLIPRAVMLLTELTCALLLFRLCLRITNHRPIAWLGSTYFVFSCVTLEGAYLCLEPFVLVFQVYAALQLWHPQLSAKHCRHAGIATALAFLSKQYGCLVIAPLTAILWKRTVREKLPKHLLAYLLLWAGMVAGAALLVIIAIAATPPLSTLRALAGGSYPPVTFASEVIWAVLFIFAPFLPVSLALLFDKAEESGRATRFGCLWLLTTAAALLVRQFPHYFLLCLPSLTVILVVTLRRLTTIFALWGQVLTLALAVVVTFHIVGLAPQPNSTLLFARSTFFRDAASTVRSILPPRTPSLVFANPQIGYLAETASIDEPLVGFGFLHNYSASFIEHLLQRASAVIVDPKDPLYLGQIDLRLRMAGPGLLERLPLLGFTRKSPADSRVQVWTRSPSPP